MGPFKLILIFIISIFISPSTWAEEGGKPLPLKEDTVYYCTDSGSNGFHYNRNSKNYEPAVFKKQRYVLKTKKYLGSIRIGDNRFTCFVPYRADKNMFICSSDAMHFHFNSKTGNFIYFRGIGSITTPDDDPEINDSLYFSMGKCVKFD